MTSSPGLTTFSPAAAAFDRCASSYDETFTHSRIGRAQREQVWTRLLAAFSPGSSILEINCGTGEDARFLAHRGRTVLACDASSHMVAVAKRHSKLDLSLAAPEFLHLANEDLSELAAHAPFDGAFSNFSGLNCLEDLHPVAAGLAKLLAPNANLLLCLWTRVCLAESMWYLLRMQPSKAFRRISGKSTAHIGGSPIAVFYPRVKAICQMFSPWFSLRSRRAIGLFVPPSYVEPWIRHRPRLLSQLEGLDRVCTRWPVFRDLGDHVLLEFVRCNP
jgi:SAM-dependent methyltransferase